VAASGSPLLRPEIGNPFEIIYDFDTLRRTPKLSAEWFRPAAHHNYVVSRTAKTGQRNYSDNRPSARSHERGRVPSARASRGPQQQCASTAVTASTARTTRSRMLGWTFPGRDSHMARSLEYVAHTWQAEAHHRAETGPSLRHGGTEDVDATELSTGAGTATDAAGLWWSRCDW
jgi:hypothetical protein